MWLSFLKIAFRVLLRNWRFSLLNLAGLTIGLASFIIILSWVKDELSYDRFHQKKNRIVQLTIKHPKGVLDPNVPYALAVKMVNQYPEIESFSTLMRMESRENCSFVFSPDSTEQSKAYEPSVVKVNEDFFDIFDFPLQYGSKSNLLTMPNAVVISSRIAEIYYPGRDPVGQTILINNAQLLTVTGVAHIPENTFFHFDFFLPIVEDLSNDWNWRDPAYLLLRPGVDIDSFNEKISSYMNDNYPGPLPDVFQVSTIPIYKTHLYFGGKGKLWLFSGVALLLLFVASLNYMNLATANYTSRMRETGIRKVLGAKRGHLIMHFFMETYILAIGALFLALFFAELILPAMAPLFGKQIEIGYLDEPLVLLALLAITVLLGSLASIYPSVLFTGGSPVGVLHRTVNPAGKRSVLILITIILQFTFSIALMISTLVVIKQTRFATKADLGFSVENVLSIPMNQGLGNNFLEFLERIESNPGVEMVTAGQSFPYNEDFKTNVEWATMEDPSLGLCRFSICLNNYLEVFGMVISDGRAYDDEFMSDVDKYIINEKAASTWGLNNPVGQSLNMWGRQGEIIGVVRDFHHVSLHREILPHVFNIHPSNYGNLRYIFVKLKTDKRAETLEYLKSACQDFAPEYPFSYTFLEDDIGHLYTIDKNMSRILGLFALLILTISSLGIFGLAFYSVEKLSRVITIRKIFGAGIWNILSLYYTSMVSRIGISLILAIALSLILMPRWLRNFAYQVHLDPFLFIVPAILALAIASLATMIAIWRSIRQNPADLIKQE